MAKKSTPKISEMKESKTLFGPISDFWTLGGLSIVFWFVIFLIYALSLNEHPAFSNNIASITGLFTALGLVVNSPHFYWSYKLSYGQGYNFIKRYWFQLVFIPIFLALLFALSYLSWTSPAMNSYFMLLGRKYSNILFFKSYFDFYPDFGSFILGLLLVLQYHTLGWHYSKQAYGTTLMNCGLTSYFLSPVQKMLLKASLMSVWINYVIEVNSGEKVFYFNGLAHSNLNWPTTLVPISRYAVILLFCSSLFYIFYSKFKQSKTKPPLRVLAPFIALFFWFSPMIYLLSPNYFALVVPFFHSLQYLTFVARVEKNSSISKPNSSPWRLSYIFFSIVFLGFIIHDFMPYVLDSKLNSFSSNGTGLFVTAAFLFLNIHHYFIDNVLWRGSNQSFRKLLLSHLEMKKELKIKNLSS